jgi:hypothetical protein
MQGPRGKGDVFLEVGISTIENAPRALLERKKWRVFDGSGIDGWVRNLAVDWRKPWKHKLSVSLQR